MSFASVADEVVAGLGPKGKRVRLAIPDDLPPVVTDRHRLELVLTNLLDNATKFSPTGTDCELGALAGGDGFTFWVRDQGIGIAPDQQARIFERFYQIDSSATRHYGGVGLGLNLVKELVESLGGSVRVDSEPAQGTTFSVALPHSTAPDGNGGRMPNASVGSAPVTEAGAD